MEDNAARAQAFLPIECLGFNVNYDVMAKHWNQSGDNLWKGRDSLSIANMFDFELVDKFRLRIASAKMAFDGKALLITFYSKSGSLVTEVRQPAVIRQCAPDMTVISISQVLAADGARENEQKTVSISGMAGRIRIETAVERSSSFLFLSKVRRYNYMGEFTSYDGK